jgi:outer membrane protein assembly factor BamB
VLLTYAGGILYACSNNGACAAIESLTGDVRWVRSYPQKTSGLMPAPPLIYGDSVVFCASDASAPFSIERTTGRVRWIPVIKFGMTNTTFPVGIHGDRIYLAGDEVTAVHARTGKILWQKSLDEPPVGKCALTKNTLYIPTETEILRVSLKNGKAKTVMRWKDPDDHAGGITLIPGGFVTVTSRMANRFEPTQKKGY